MDFPIWNLFLLLTGLALIAKSADKFVDAAVAIAQRLCVPEVIIGATIVSLGTTIPEFTVSITSGIFDRPQTTMGDAIGSNIANIALVLGICLVVRSAAINRRLHLQQGAIMLLASLTVILLSVDGLLCRWDSLILTLGLGGYCYYSVRAAQRERSGVISGLRQDGAGVPTREGEAVIPSDACLRRRIAWFAIGAIGVLAGATLIVQNAVIVARGLGVSELVLALTVVAVGTSLPELATAVTATLKGHPGIAVGNMIGACILCLLWVRGVGGFPFSSPLPIEPHMWVLDYPVMLMVMTLLLVFGAMGGQLKRWHGITFLAIYAAYASVLYLFLK